MNDAAVSLPPKFRVLDVVEVAAADAPLIGSRAGGQRGAVLSIRRYGDGSYRYAIGSILDGADADDDEVGGIYDEQYLLATGTRTKADRYGPLPPFMLRDVVEVATDCDDLEVRGRRGYVYGACSPEPGASPIGVWIYGLEEFWVIDARHLTRTGERLPAPPVGQPMSSTRVSRTGDVLGHTAFVVVDDIEQYL